MCRATACMCRNTSIRSISWIAESRYPRSPTRALEACRGDAACRSWVRPSPSALDARDSRARLVLAHDLGREFGEYAHLREVLRGPRIDHAERRTFAGIFLQYFDDAAFGDRPAQQQ